MDRSRDRTREVYDRIAEHFSSTREHPWPEVEAFLAGRSGTRGLDVGCGNGRHAQELAACCERVVGVDASRGLLGTASARASDRGYADVLDLVAGDASRLPLATGSVDLAVYVATLHHLPHREARVRSLNELARVLAANGTALVSAWSTAHDTFEDASADDDTGFDTTVDWTLPGGETVPRFYHVYSPAEFERDLAESALSVANAFVSSGNCYSKVASERKTS
jgi:ubiquinone/menaquinone biosynthesis C-methylase UbiE